jgi:putative acetyltransferase
MSYTIREIRKEDETAIAAVIRKILEEHGMAKPGTVYTDPTTDHLFELFKKPNSHYFILTDDTTIVGGCGVYPTKGLPHDTAELVKLYILPKARGKGWGKTLLLRCAEYAKSVGYQKLYLESMPELSAAVDLYTSVGYKQLEAPMGDSGHHACNLWMLKEL